MSDPKSEPPGCAACRAVPASRDELRLERVRNLYEGPHDGYAIFRCPACGTPFLEQFQEITWLPSGEDDIWLRWMPLTPDELAEVEALFPEEAEDPSNAHHLARLMHRRGRVVSQFGRARLLPSRLRLGKRGSAGASPSRSRPN